jgi:hypothetical protein
MLHHTEKCCIILSYCSLLSVPSCLFRSVCYLLSVPGHFVVFTNLDSQFSLLFLVNLIQLSSHGALSVLSLHDTVSNVADRQISQTFKQEGKQLGVLAAGMQQEVDISGS